MKNNLRRSFLIYQMQKGERERERERERNFIYINLKNIFY